MMQTPSVRRLFLCAAIVWLITGCAATPGKLPSDPASPVTLSPAAQGHGWWSVRFRLDRPEKKTRWERDLLIAHRVAAVLISAHEDDLGLWRFHRRSADDGAGHQFSFLFYTSAETADKINRMVASDPLVEALLSTGVIMQVLTDDIDRNDRPAVSDTSDPKWSPVMQNTWPHFIMGVSRMWLAMIDQISKQISGQISTEVGSADGPTVKQLLDHYQLVNKEVTGIWQQEAYHALLHHLNAIYGYEAMVYWEKRWKSF
jgi:hypothetical protein